MSSHLYSFFLSYNDHNLELIMIKVASLGSLFELFLDFLFHLLDQFFRVVFNLELGTDRNSKSHFQIFLSIRKVEIRGLVPRPHFPES